MNMHPLIAITAATLMAAGFSSAFASDADQGRAEDPAARRIVALPAVMVRPAQEDLAFYRSNKMVVELKTVTVRPAPMDRAYFLAHRPAGIDVRSPEARAASEQLGLSGVNSSASTQQVASR